MKVPVTNNTKMPMWVGSSMIPPGETRHFEAHHVPQHLRPKSAVKAKPEAPAPITTVLDKTIPEIVALMPTWSDEDLDAIKQAEQAGKTRAGLMKSIAEEELRRADAKVENPGAGDTGETDETTQSGEDDQANEETLPA